MFYKHYLYVVKVTVGNHGLRLDHLEKVGIQQFNFRFISFSIDFANTMIEGHPRGSGEAHGEARGTVGASGE